MTITLALVACATTPKQPVSPTPTPIASLRATLARAGIKLQLASGPGGHDRTVDGGDCSSDAADPRPCLRCRLTSEAELHEPKLDAITRAFATYPTSVLARAGVDHVAVCTEITGTCRSNGEDDGRTSGFIDPNTRGMFLDITHMNDPTLPWYEWIMGDTSAAELVHHELFHLLEHRQAKELMREDREWDALNLIGFVYHWANAEGDLMPGFLSVYSMTRVAEDKATLYGMLLDNPAYVCEKADGDAVLRAKLELLWQRVRAMTGTDSFLREAAPCAARYSR